MENNRQLIEPLLQPFERVLGEDYDRYRNHVYRVFLNCLALDNDPGQDEKYAVAAVYHDIGIWTGLTFDYLYPSVQQVVIYLNQIGRPDWIEEITAMIRWHHKMSRYGGEFKNSVENFRKADWIDVSWGVLYFGLPKRRIREYRRQFPNAGFHLFLLRQCVRHFLKHPLNPIPVLKW